MSVLDSRTNKNQNPKGKAKVWFCAHPEDHEKYFEPVKNEILAKQDCAVWFDKEPTAEYDENFFTDLSQMRLFVMPVTKKLLTTENRALCVEFAFAMEKHIPVLPLMQERGLEALFNEKCGDLQFLDKNVNDITAISYDEKLEKYLDSVIIGDKLAKEIRESFDAYVFLSYRKKDRRYAQELMRLIHKNDFCRDIAIWYDEFLTPGEDFNKNITEALEKSAFFALAVTPNLLEEPNGKPNYVMEHEFPDARDAGKRIVPAELVPTDREELKRKYERIPEITDAYDEAMLSDALKRALEGVALRGNDSDPQHNFYIGLAYLGGVDVERDSEKALSLIGFAADAGLPTAVKKLADMYKNGDGVARDYEKSAEWQKKYVEICKENYEADDSLSNGKEYIGAMVNLGKVWESLYRFEESIEAYKNAVEIGKSICKSAKNQNVQRNYLNSEFNNLSGAKNIKLPTHTSDKASYLNQISDIMSYINVRIDILFFDLIISNMVTSLSSLSCIYTKLGAYKDAALCGENLLFFLEAGEIVTPLNKSLIYSTVAANYCSYGNIKKAKEYLQKLLDMYSNGGVGDLAVSPYGLLGVIAEKEKDYEKALEYYTNELEIDKARGLEENIITSYNKLADIALISREYDKSEDFYLKALEDAKKNDEKHGTIDSRKNLADTYLKLSKLYTQMGKESDSEIYFDKYAEVMESLAEKAEYSLISRELCSYYGEVGDRAFKKGDYGKAELYLGRSIKILEDIAESDESGRLQDMLLLRYQMMDELKQMKARGGVIDTHKIYRDRIKLYREVAERTDDTDAWKHLLEDHTGIGGLLEEKGSLLEAKGHYEKRLGAAKRLYEKAHDAETKRELAQSYMLLGRINEKLRDRYEAEENYAQEFILRSELASDTGSAKDRASYAEVFMNLGNNSGFLKRRKYLKISLSMLTALAAEYPEDKNIAKLLNDVKKSMRKK